ncbi:hypothetical protein FRC01_004802 [Tulasnella sp. 417]|nr:hypothetical protein FRC01_004802 [Tulasnella sp. 417]
MAAWRPLIGRKKFSYVPRKMTPDHEKTTNNPQGRNQWGNKDYPPDDILREALHEYARRKYDNPKRLEALANDYGLQIGLTKLKELQRRFNIPSVRRRKSPDEETSLVAHHVNKDTEQANGPRAIADMLRLEGTPIPRTRIRSIMLSICPEGFDKRFPGSRRITRAPLTAFGAMHEIASDGHLKLGSQALKMGPVGLPIYGMKDKWTSYVPLLVTAPNVQTEAAIAHLYLDFVELEGAIPVQFTTDCGSETGWIYALQYSLRETLAPDVDREKYPPHKFIKSVHNTVIEGFWSWFRKKCGKTIKSAITRGRDEGRFNPNNPLHIEVFYFIFAPLLQQELDTFRLYWNYHEIRAQPEKQMPSRHIPIDAFENPADYGGVDCRIPVPQEMAAELRARLETEVGSRERNVEFLSLEVRHRLGEVYASLGSPELDFGTCWEVFTDMGLKKCEACLKDTGTTPGIASMAPTAGLTSHSAGSESGPISPAGAAAATAVLRRSEATAVRLRKTTPAPTAMRLAQGPQPAGATVQTTVHPLSDSSNVHSAGTVASGSDSKITIICQVRLSTKPGVLDARFGKSIADWSASELIPVKNQFNLTWLPMYHASLNTQRDVALRLRDNAPLANGTATDSVGGFYNYYEKHPSGTCSIQEAKKAHKSAVLGKKVLMLELYIDVDQFKRRTNGEQEKRSIHKSISGVTRSVSGSRPHAGNQGRARSTSTPRSTGSASISRRMPSTISRTSAPSQRRISSTSSALSSSGSGYQTIHFKRLVLRLREPVSGRLITSIVVDNEDQPDSASLTAEVRKLELARGAMKQVYEAKYKDKLFVAKKYYRLDTTVRTRQTISAQANYKAIQDEMIRYGKAAFWLNAFLDAARDAQIDIDNRACGLGPGIEITDAFIAKEEDGMAWLFEPRRTVADPIKFSGTMSHNMPAHSQTDKTVQAFVHYVFAQTSGRSIGQLSTGLDGIVLFDLMTHTTEEDSGPGDHGTFGIQAWEDQHVCNEICSAFEVSGLFEIEEATDEAQEPPRKRRKLEASEDDEIVLLGSSQGRRESRAMRQLTPPNFDDDDADLPDLTNPATAPAIVSSSQRVSDDDGAPLSTQGSEVD